MKVLHLTYMFILPKENVYTGATMNKTKLTFAALKVLKSKNASPCDKNSI